MIKKFSVLVILSVMLQVLLKAQKTARGIIEGRIFNQANNSPIPFANLVIWGTNTGTVSDTNGKFIFTGVKPGYVRITASSVGFGQYTTGEFLVTNAKKVFIEVPLTESKVNISEITVKASPFRKSEESPLSLRRIGIEQIEKNPGGNRDISRVIQSFPGVAATPAYRNDVIVRGGGPAENRFYLDGVEIPNLNHFATQGASGGPVGIINVDFIREVNFYSGAFPAKTDNTLSSVLDMRMINGNKDKIKFRGSIGASDLALTTDGPVGKKTTFIASVRRSYLQFLFSALQLPFLPTYNDFQFKTRTRIGEKREISFIGLGALDQSSLNLHANSTPEQRYILSYLPVNEQWTYTFGAVYKHFHKKGYNTWVLSRNYLNNVSYKYINNDKTQDKILDYSSHETENKLRFENNSETNNGYRLNLGGDLQYAQYYNKTDQKIFRENRPLELRYNSFIDMFHYGAFGQASHTYFNERLSLSLGIRMDGSTWSKQMENPLSQLSPRFSSSLALTQKLSWNFNIGRYFERPPYTALGYRDSSGVLINRKNGLKYIRADHYVTGFELRPNNRTRITLEGFYKNYAHYPFSVTDSVSLSTKGADFGVIGTEELTPVASGRAFGFELMWRSQDLYGFNIVLSYTLVRSEFKDLRSGYRGTYIPTSWDNRSLLNFTATRTFKSNWYLGFKWRFAGGSPYTPYDVTKSAIKEAWDAQGGPYLNYSKFNSLRLKAFHQLDLRIDKQYYFKSWSLDIYIDIQNVYNFKAEQPDYLVRKSFVDPGYNDYNPATDTYELEKIPAFAGTVLPTAGIIIEF